MRIWVDADACPNAVKEILYRAVQRTSVPMKLVANRPIRVPPSPLIDSVQVASGFDVADNYILQHISTGDLVITADIPLAAELIAKQAAVIDPRGEQYTDENIRQRLSMRDFMEEMRAIGEAQGGSAPLGKRDLQAFANALDRFLTRRASRQD